MIQHLWTFGFNKRKKHDFKFGTSVQIHTRIYIENLASYKTPADADLPKTRLAQARNCRPGIVAGTMATASPNSI